MQNLAITAALGVFVGIVLVAWVRPETTPGSIFLIFVSWLVVIILSAAVRFVQKARRRPVEGDKSDS